MRTLERELAAMTEERNTMKTALESVESERIKYRERAWHAESQLETRYGLRKEINTELGLTDETGDDALRKGLETIRAIKSEINELKEKFLKSTDAVAEAQDF